MPIPARFFYCEHQKPAALGGAIPGGMRGVIASSQNGGPLWISFRHVVAQHFLLWPVS